MRYIVFYISGQQYCNHVIAVLIHIPIYIYTIHVDVLTLKTPGPTKQYVPKGLRRYKDIRGHVGVAKPLYIVEMCACIVHLFV